MDFVEVAVAVMVGGRASVEPIGEAWLRVVDIARDWEEATPIPTAGSTPGSLAVGGLWASVHTVLLLTSGPTAALHRGPDLRATENNHTCGTAREESTDASPLDVLRDRDAGMDAPGL